MLVVDTCRTLPERHKSAEITKAIAWRERRLVFREDKLSFIVSEFNRYNRPISLISWCKTGSGVCTMPHTSCIKQLARAALQEMLNP
jgi:hypothetical protein